MDSGESRGTGADTPVVVASPCAACKILRRRCAERCVLAPYFPPTDPLKFAIAHRVFGASNIIKLLQELREPQRADAVSSLVYEANARIRDPVYGSAGAIFNLQNQVNELQAQLAQARAELVTMQLHHSNLLSVFSCMGPTPSSSPDHPQYSEGATPGFPSPASSLLLDGVDPSLASVWEPLWA